MKNKSDGVNETKFVENNAIVIVLFVFFIVLTPYVISIIGNSWKKADEISTKNTIEMVKLLYISEIATSEIIPPFKVEYNRKGYDTYSNGVKYTPLNLNKVKSKGQRPKGGSVTIKGDGTVKVKNLRFGILKCNSDKDENIKCGL